MVRFLFALLCAFGLAFPALAADLDGLWIARAPDSPTQRTLEIRRDGAGWTALIDGQAASVEAEANRITVRGPDERAFEGVLSPDGAAIEGYWYQPANRYAYSRMETRVNLARAEDGVWRATFAVQPRPFRMYLDVFEDDEGELRAAIRNPERNEFERARSFGFEPHAEGGWMLVAGSGERERRRRLRQPDADTLVLEHSWLGDLTLHRASEADRVGYFADVEGAGRGYTVPEQTGDGWATLSARDAGFDRSALDALVAELAADSSRDLRMIHSLLVAHRGKLLMEEYFYGYDRETVHDVRSLAKVFGSVMVGALQQDGEAIDADMPVVAKVVGNAMDDPRKADITLRNMLTFTSGLDCSGVGGEDAMWSQEEEDNFWRVTARQPLVHPIGTRYEYCSGSANMVGAALTMASGQRVQDIFARLIADPLKMRAYHWNVMPTGQGYLGGGVYMRPRDILKIGATYAAGGVWQGRRIVPEEWIAESTTPVLPISLETTGMTQEEYDNNYSGGAQGYIWLVKDIEAAGRSYRAYRATGNGGQILLVVPELELSVVFTGGNYNLGGIWSRWPDNIVGERIIPALVGSQMSPAH